MVSPKSLSRIAEIIMGGKGIHYDTCRCERREHRIWMQWLPKISEVNAVDRDRPISPNIFADAWLADRYCEDIVLVFCN